MSSQGQINPLTVKLTDFMDAIRGSAVFRIRISDLKALVTAGKQDTLVSGENIKTINGDSILGSGNLTISGGGGSGNGYFPQGWG